MKWFTVRRNGKKRILSWKVPDDLEWSGSDNKFTQRHLCHFRGTILSCFFCSTKSSPNLLTLTLGTIGINLDTNSTEAQTCNLCQAFEYQLTFELKSRTKNLSSVYFFLNSISRPPALPLYWGYLHWNCRGPLPQRRPRSGTCRRNSPCLLIFWTSSNLRIYRLGTARAATASPVERTQHGNWLGVPALVGPLPVQVRHRGSTTPQLWMCGPALHCTSPHSVRQLPPPCPWWV